MKECRTSRIVRFASRHPCCFRTAGHRVRRNNRIPSGTSCRHETWLSESGLSSAIGQVKPIQNAVLLCMYSAGQRALGLY
jgi:hypothetical protein